MMFKVRQTVGHKNSLKTSKQRSQRGSLAEGVVSIWLVVTVTVGAILLFVNVAIATYYKQKIAFVASQCAEYGVKNVSWMGVRKPNINEEQLQESIEQRASMLFSNMGMPKGAVEVKDNKDSITVKIRLTNLAMVGNGAFLLPTFIAMEDTASALVDDQKPPAILHAHLHDYGAGNNPYAGRLFQRVQIPVYLPPEPTTHPRSGGRSGTPSSDSALKMVAEVWTNAYGEGHTPFSVATQKAY